MNAAIATFLSNAVAVLVVVEVSIISLPGAKFSSLHFIISWTLHCYFYFFLLSRCLQQQRINKRVNIIELRPWKLNVVNLPVRPVEYCRHPDGALKIYSNI